MEMSLLPNGIAINASHHYAGSISDISILRKNSEFHENALLRNEGDPSTTEVADNKNGLDEHPHCHAAIADKGYQGIMEELRVITQYKETPNAFLTRAEEMFNKKISSDRIVAENFFGRLKGL